MADPVVLIVDDNDDNRFTLSMRLEACGYENIVTAENGREALEKMRQGPVDLVLLRNYDAGARRLWRARGAAHRDPNREF